MSQDPTPNPTILNNDPTPNPDPNPDPNPNPDPTPDPNTQSIYDFEVKWPDGTEDNLKNEPLLKPFISKDKGIDTASLLKSYAHTKKQYGREKITLPTDKSTDEEINEFYNKLYGYDPVLENYKIDIKEEDKEILDTEFSESIRKFAHDRKLSPKVAQELHDFMIERAKKDSDDGLVIEEKARTDGIEILKQQWGGAYNTRITAAKKIISDYIKDDEELYNAFQEKHEIGSNPFILKLLGTIGAKLYKEGTFGEDPMSHKTPEDIEKEIGAIRGDPSHAFNNPEHPNHAKAQKDMYELYEQRAKYIKK